MKQCWKGANINSEGFVFPVAEPVEDLPSAPVLNAAQRDALESSDLTPGWVWTAIPVTEEIKIITTLHERFYSFSWNFELNKLQLTYPVKACFYVTVIEIYMNWMFHK